MCFLVQCGGIVWLPIYLQESLPVRSGGMYTSALSTSNMPTSFPHISSPPPTSSFTSLPPLVISPPPSLLSLSPHPSPHPPTTSSCDPTRQGKQGTLYLPSTLWQFSPLYLFWWRGSNGRRTPGMKIYSRLFVGGKLPAQVVYVVEGKGGRGRVSGVVV